MDTLSFAVQQEVDPDNYFQAYLKNDVRPSGRIFSNYRQINLQAGTVAAPNVYGSAQAQIGETIVTCGVNLMVGSPSLEEPQKGDIVCDVTLTPMCDVKYDQKSKHTDAYNLEVIVLDTVIRGKVVELEQLCILKGKYAYRLVLNIVCLSNGGNLVDAVILAATAALRNVRLPEPIVKKDTVEVDTNKLTPLVTVPAEAAVPVTVGVFNRDVYLVDPSRDEERVLQGQVTCVVDTRNNNLRLLRQSVNGGLTPTQTFSVVDLCIATALANSTLLSGK